MWQWPVVIQYTMYSSSIHSTVYIIVFTVPCTMYVVYYVLEFPDLSILILITLFNVQYNSHNVLRVRRTLYGHCTTYAVCTMYVVRRTGCMIRVVTGVYTIILRAWMRCMLHVSSDWSSHEIAAVEEASALVVHFYLDNRSVQGRAAIDTIYYVIPDRNNFLHTGS